MLSSATNALRDWIKPINPRSPDVTATLEEMPHPSCQTEIPCWSCLTCTQRQHRRSEVFQQWCVPPACWRWWPWCWAPRARAPPARCAGNRWEPRPATEEQSSQLPGWTESHVMAEQLLGTGSSQVSSSFSYRRHFSSGSWGSHPLSPS